MHLLEKNFLQLAEKSLFEDVEILDQMKQLMAELGPGMSSVGIVTFRFFA